METQADPGHGLEGRSTKIVFVLSGSNGLRRAAESVREVLEDVDVDVSMYDASSLASHPSAESRAQGEVRGEPLTA